MKHTRRTILGAIAAAFVPAWLKAESEFRVWTVSYESKRRAEKRQTITLGDGTRLKLPGPLTPWWYDTDNDKLLLPHHRNTRLYFHNLWACHEGGFDIWRCTYTDKWWIYDEQIAWPHVFLDEKHGPVFSGIHKSERDDAYWQEWLNSEARRQNT